MKVKEILSWRVFKFVGIGWGCIGQFISFYTKPFLVLLLEF